MTTLRQLLTVLVCAVVLAMSAFTIIQLRALGAMSLSSAEMAAVFVPPGVFCILAMASFVTWRALWLLGAALLLAGIGVLFGIGRFSIWYWGMAVCVLALAFWHLRASRTTNSQVQEF